MNDIAKSVGIKKQSIYSHFTNKEEIFLCVMDDVVNKEITFVKNHCIRKRKESLDSILYRLLMKYRDRYLHQNDLELKCLLRMAFMPPFKLQEIATKKIYTYDAELKEAVITLFSSYHLSEELIKVGTYSFLNVLDGLLVSLIYSNSTISEIDQRLISSWDIYWEGFSNKFNAR